MRARMGFRESYPSTRTGMKSESRVKVGFTFFSSSLGMENLWYPLA